MTANVISALEYIEEVKESVLAGDRADSTEAGEQQLLLLLEIQTILNGSDITLVDRAYDEVEAKTFPENKFFRGAPIWMQLDEAGRQGEQLALLREIVKTYDRLLTEEGCKNPKAAQPSLLSTTWDAEIRGVEWGLAAAAKACNEKHIDCVERQGIAANRRDKKNSEWFRAKAQAAEALALWIPNLEPKDIVRANHWKNAFDDETTQDLISSLEDSDKEPAPVILNELAKLWYSGDITQADFVNQILDAIPREARLLDCLIRYAQGRISIIRDPSCAITISSVTGPGPSKQEETNMNHLYPESDERPDPSEDQPDYEGTKYEGTKYEKNSTPSLYANNPKIAWVAELGSVSWCNDHELIEDTLVVSFADRFAPATLVCQVHTNDISECSVFSFCVRNPDESQLLVYSAYIQGFLDSHP